MVSQVVSVRLEREVLELIDMLVRFGVFSSRSEALRELVKVGIKSYEGLSRIARAVEKLFEMEEMLGDIPIRLEGGLRELLEDRDRL